MDTDPMLGPMPGSPQFDFRKKVKKFNAKVIPSPLKILWRPPAGVTMVLRAAFIKTRSRVGGTITNPSLQIDNGTNGQDIVATVAADRPTDGWQRLTVIGNYVFDNDNPLRLRNTVESSAITEHYLDFVLFASKVSD